ncbi:hypothetical protein FKM82_016810 [Ascaphus truei]
MQFTNLFYATPAQYCHVTGPMHLTISLYQDKGRLIDAENETKGSYPRGAQLQFSSSPNRSGFQDIPASAQEAQSVRASA